MTDSQSKSDGNTIFDANSEFNIFLASFTKFASYNDRPISYPLAFKKVFKIPPPKIIWSHLLKSFFITISFVDTLAPEIIIVMGLEFSLISLLIVEISCLIFKPG